jgi:hypothetical protein
MAGRTRYFVHESGRRAILGIDVGETQTETFWRQVLKSLIAPQRGSADADAGRKAAIVRHLHFPWQRCPSCSSGTAATAPATSSTACSPR